MRKDDNAHFVLIGWPRWLHLGFYLSFFKKPKCSELCSEENSKIKNDSATTIGLRHELQPFWMRAGSDHASHASHGAQVPVASKVNDTDGDVEEGIVASKVMTPWLREQWSHRALRARSP